MRHWQECGGGSFLCYLCITELLKLGADYQAEGMGTAFDSLVVVVVVFVDVVCCFVIPNRGAQGCLTDTNKTAELFHGQQRSVKSGCWSLSARRTAKVKSFLLSLFPSFNAV